MRCRDFLALLSGPPRTRGCGRKRSVLVGALVTNPFENTSARTGCNPCEPHSAVWLDRRKNEAGTLAEVQSQQPADPGIVFTLSFKTKAITQRRLQLGIHARKRLTQAEARRKAARDPNPLGKKLPSSVTS